MSDLRAHDGTLFDEAFKTERAYSSVMAEPEFMSEKIVDQLPEQFTSINIMSHAATYNTATKLYATSLITALFSFKSLLVLGLLGAGISYVLMNSGHPSHPSEQPVLAMNENESKAQPETKKLSELKQSAPLQNASSSEQARPDDISESEKRNEDTNQQTIKRTKNQKAAQKKSSVKAKPVNNPDKPISQIKTESDDSQKPSTETKRQAEQNNNANQETIVELQAEHAESRRKPINKLAGEVMLYKDAKSYEQAGNLRRAAELYRLYLNKHPDGRMAGAASYALIRLYRSVGHEEAARKYVKKHLKKYRFKNDEIRKMFKL